MAKVMILHHSFAIGGGSISFLDIIKMIEEEHEVIVGCPGDPPDLLDYLNEKDITVIPLEIPIPTFNHYNGGHSILTRTFWKGVANYKYHKEWKSFFEKYNPDVIIVNSAVMALLGPVIKSVNAKAICFVRETFNESPFNIKTHMMRYMLNEWFDGVLFISKYDKNKMGLTKPLTEVVADVFNRKNFNKIEKEKAIKNFGLSPEDFHVLYMGGLSWLKGLDTALESLKYLKEKNIKLIIAGEINIKKEKLSFRKKFRTLLYIKTWLFKRKIKFLLKNQNISEKIKIVGLQIDMTFLYSAADVVIFPSNLPHQARPVFEAGLYSLPIIISDFKQTREYVINGENALTFKPKDAFDLSQSIITLYNDYQLTNKLGAENYNMTVKYHNFEVEKEKLINFLEVIIKSE